MDLKSLRNINSENTFEASLMPVVYWKYENKKKSEWKSLFGLIGSLDYVHNNGIKDYDFGIFPFFNSLGGVIALSGQLVQQVAHNLHLFLSNFTLARNIVFPR